MGACRLRSIHTFWLYPFGFILNTNLEIMTFLSCLFAKMQAFFSLQSHSYLRFSIFLGLLFYVVSPIFSINGQIKVVPLPSKKGMKLHKTAENERAPFLNQNDTIFTTLPFFDDFTGVWYRQHDTPDTTLWQADSSTVLISGYMGIAPPSFNVAVFDGVDAFGSLYNDVLVAQGETDRLRSNFIDLSEKNIEDSIFISFYYQLKGRGERPDPNDYLSLEFQNEDSLWVEVWRQRAFISLNDSIFTQVILPINQTQFLHRHFRFQFKSRGRQSGTYDTWNLDYIYLDESRNATDSSRLDIAISEYPNFLTQPYTAFPYAHFWSDTSLFTIDTVRATANNLDNIFNVLSYQCRVSEAETGSTLGFWWGKDSLKTTTSDIIEGSQRQYPLVAVPYVAFLPQNRDSLTLKYTFELNTSEPDSIFRTNDTLSQTIVFKDYYAYDDGSAEYAAAINQKFGKLAYRYHTPNRLEMSHIDINFVDLGGVLENQTFNLFVWKKLDTARSNLRDSVLLQQNIVVRFADRPNQFVRVRLSRDIAVQDSFYIGIQQLTDSPLPIGLDRNTNSGQELFYNVRNAWQKNEIVRGSLLLRPVFAAGKITSLPPEENINFDIKLYPNPLHTPSVLFLEGEIEEVEIFDLRGTPILQQRYETRQNQVEIALPALAKGLYLVKIRRGTQILTKKMIIL